MLAKKPKAALARYRQQKKKALEELEKAIAEYRELNPVYFFNELATEQWALDKAVEIKESLTLDEFHQVMQEIPVTVKIDSSDCALVTAAKVQQAIDQYNGIEGEVIPTTLALDDKTDP